LAHQQVQEHPLPSFLKTIWTLSSHPDSRSTNLCNLSFILHPNKLGTPPSAHKFSSKVSYRFPFYCLFTFCSTCQTNPWNFPRASTRQRARRRIPNVHQRGLSCNASLLQLSRQSVLCRILKGQSVRQNQMEISLDQIPKYVY
jgi:hypothetical protein